MSILDDLGLDVKMMLAGFSGGVTHQFFFGKRDFYSSLGSMIGGLFTANYLAPSVAHYLGAPDAPIGFIVGLTALIFCQGVVSLVRIRVGAEIRDKK